VLDSCVDPRAGVDATKKREISFPSANDQGQLQTPQSVFLLPSHSFPRLYRIVHTFMTYVLHIFVLSSGFDMSVFVLCITV
jgi:hypothetical protein